MLKLKMFVRDNKNVLSLVLFAMLGFVFASLVTYVVSLGMEAERNNFKKEQITFSYNDTFMTDLTKMKVTKTRVTTSRLNNKELFVVYREDKEQNQFITIFEPIDNLRYNAKEYEKHLENEASKIGDDKYLLKEVKTDEK